MVGGSLGLVVLVGLVGIEGKHWETANVESVIE